MRLSMALTPLSLTEQQRQPLRSSSHSSYSCPESFSDPSLTERYSHYLYSILFASYNQEWFEKFSKHVTRFALVSCFQRCLANRLFLCVIHPSPCRENAGKAVLAFWKRVSAFWKRVSAFLKTSFTITVPIGYSNLGYSGRAAYSDLNPRDEPPSVHK